MLVCKQAPDFTAGAVLADGKIVNPYTLSEVLKDKYGLLFFYPLDFTFVCPTELIALDKRMDEFKKRNVEVIGVSIDSVYTHQAWRNTPVNKGGIGPVNYTLVGDIKHEISKAYGIQHPEEGISLRAAFLIDKCGKVRSQLVNDAPIGRNIDELLRLVDALQFHETYGEVCPAGWQKGNKAFNASAEGVANYLTEHSEQL
ncbi:MAG: peroxiredoxin [Gammaproteobacteria bacterium]